MTDATDAPPTSRSRGWSRIRGKLQDLSTAATSKKHDRNTSQDISDFLGKTPSTQSPTEDQDPRPFVPRINTLPNEPSAQPEWATRPEDIAVAHAC